MSVADAGSVPECGGLGGLDVLFVHNGDTIPVVGSQSYFDSAEGFEYTITEPGDYQIMIAHEPGATACEATEFGSGTEPYGWALF